MAWQPCHVEAGGVESCPQSERVEQSAMLRGLPINRRAPMVHTSVVVIFVISSEYVVDILVNRCVHCSDCFSSRTGTLITSCGTKISIASFLNDIRTNLSARFYSTSLLLRLGILFFLSTTFLIHLDGSHNRFSYCVELIHRYGNIVYFNDRKTKQCWSKLY